jgi:ABC-2 family transporter protein
MTALTMSAQPAQSTALRPLPWRRMVWVTWRQHRPTLLSVPALLGAVAVFLLIAGLKIHHDYAVLTACHPFDSAHCQALNSNFNHADWTLANTILILLQLAPALIGAFAGAPVLARELETGTYRYAWSQGYGRTRWTIAKLVLLAATITATAGAFSQVFTWFFQPFIKQEDMTVLNATVFDTRGVAFAAWTLAGFSIGVLAGMFIRRIVPAMAITLGVYLGLQLLTWVFLRPHYPVSRFWPMQFVEGGWLLVLSVLLIAATVWLVRHRAA